MPKGLFNKNGDWWIDYYANGQRHREKIGIKRSIAKEVLAIRQGEIAKGTFIPKKDRKRKSGVRFNDFAQEYLTRHSKVNNTKSWKTADLPNINKLKIHFGNKYLEEITPRQIAEFKSIRIREVSGSTVNIQLSYRRKIYKLLKAKGLTAPLSIKLS